MKDNRDIFDFFAIDYQSNATLSMGLRAYHNQSTGGVNPYIEATISSKAITDTIDVYIAPSFGGDNLLPNHTAIEQVRRVALRRNAGAGEADAMLERVGLAQRRRHRPDEMSGGEQQRLAFARGAVGSPAVVIADEPTAELDSHSGARVIDTMRELAELGTTIVVASHDPAVMQGADHIVTLRDGALASVTSRDEELAVIDQSGRIQLPPHVRSWFPSDRAVLHVDEDNHRIWIDRP